MEEVPVEGAVDTGEVRELAEGEVECDPGEDLWWKRGQGGFTATGDELKGLC